MSDRDELIGALDSAAATLIALRPAVERGAPWPLADRFDHAPEASWGPPELLAHVAEMLTYWYGEVERVLAGRPGETVAFGRTGEDPIRIAIIGRDRSLPVGELFERIGAGTDRWRARLGTLSDDDLARPGLHPTRGELPVEEIVRRMVVGHLGEHAEQLSGILTPDRGV
jgi:hypothetical protein